METVTGFNFQTAVSTELPTCDVKEANVDSGSDESIVEQFSPITTLLCDDQSIERVCAVIGSLASHWGYFERESIYLISKRLEIFFQDATYTALGKIFVFLLNLCPFHTFFADYAWLVRAIRVLWALGDTAFREITVYFEKIDTTIAPEWMHCHLNVSSCNSSYS